MIGAEWLYWLIGAFFIAIAAMIAADAQHARRWGNASFWGLLGLSFLYGTFVEDDKWPAWVLGVAVLAMCALAGFGLTGKAKEKTTTREEREASASALGNRLFIPALVIPAVTIVFALAGPHIIVDGKPILATGTETLTGLGVSSVAATVVAILLMRPKRPVRTSLAEGGRLLEAIGWAALLPQMLSTLGTLFTDAGVGNAVGSIVTGVLPKGSLFAAIAVYLVGMALFTVIMGNAFAAFPIMTAAVGWPILVGAFHGNPAPIFAIGMLSGFCGTLVTPMAANFNLVPAALLDMKSKYGAIKAQFPTAIVILLANIGILYAVAF